MLRSANDVENELAAVMRAYDAALREYPRDHEKVDRLAVRLNVLREELRMVDEQEPGDRT